MIDVGDSPAPMAAYTPGASRTDEWDEYREMHPREPDPDEMCCGSGIETLVNVDSDRFGLPFGRRPCPGCPAVRASLELRRDVDP